jgi:DNA-binding transcriptional LysR family regulator
MKSFIHVVDSESFSVAARNLRLSRALVSRHIADLEQQLGARLLNRTTRAVTLTEAGIGHYEFCRRILNELTLEEESLRKHTELPEGHLNIVAPKWIGSMDLGDAILSFAAEHPLIKINLDLGGVSDRTHEFLSSGFEIAFQTNYLRDSSVMVKKMAMMQYVICAAPSYLAKTRRPIEPRDLVKQKCLMLVNEPIWHFNFEEEMLRIKPEDVVFTSNTFLLLLKAALNGMGVALLPLRAIRRELQRGELEVLLPNYSVPDRPLYAVYAPGMQRVRKTQCFLEFMSQWYQVHSMLDGMPRDAGAVLTH